MNINISEIFYSIQGEGLHVGAPSLFIRTFGCNLSCPGFGTASLPPLGDIDIKTITDVKDLPGELFTKGCDSGYAHLAEYRHLAKKMTASEIVIQAHTLVPDEAWGHPGWQSVHIVFTGGEPLMQQKGLATLIRELSMEGFKNFTFETNGTKPLTPEFVGTLLLLRDCRFTFSVSPKLSNSGEYAHKTLVPEAVKSYRNLTNAKVVLKFVVRDPEMQASELFSFVEAYNHMLPPHKESVVYLMPEGADGDQYHSRDRLIAEFCLKWGFHYSPRLHVDLFGNAIGS